MNHLVDNIAVVTGAASGIGRATAIAFADAGCRVVCVDIDEVGLDETRARIERAVPDATIGLRTVDVADAEAMDELAASVVDEFDGVDIIVNNAGINITGRFDQHSLEDFQRTFDVNLWGVIHGCRAFLPYLRRQNRGHVVNISSIFGVVGVTGQAAYCASKFAVRGLSETLHEELAATDIGVSVVFPGCIDTDIIHDATIHDTTVADDIRNYFTTHGHAPAVVADRIVDAVRRNRHRVVVTPESHVLDLLRRLAPTLGNRIANRLMSRLLGLTLD